MYQLNYPVAETFLVLAGVSLFALVAVVVIEKCMGDSGTKTFLKIALLAVAIYGTILTITVPHERARPLQAKVISTNVQGHDGSVLAKLERKGDHFFLDIPRGMPVGKTVTVYQQRKPSASAWQLAKRSAKRHWASLCALIDSFDISELVNAFRTDHNYGANK